MVRAWRRFAGSSIYCVVYSLRLSLCLSVCLFTCSFSYCVAFSLSVPLCLTVCLSVCHFSSLFRSFCFSLCLFLSFLLSLFACFSMCSFTHSILDSFSFSPPYSFPFPPFVCLRVLCAQSLVYCVISSLSLPLSPSLQLCMRFSLFSLSVYQLTCPFAIILRFTLQRSLFLSS